MIFNLPRADPRPKSRVGAPGGFKCHYFYWYYLKSPLRCRLDISFDWSRYQYVLSKSRYVKYLVVRKNSHSWYLVYVDMKRVIINIKHFKKSKQIIEYLEKEIKKNDF